MTAMRDRYEGNYLDGGDIPEGKMARLVIEKVTDPNTEKDARGKLIDGAILTFVGHEKRMILNVTNYLVLKSLFGPEGADWIGKEIRVQRRYIVFQGVPNTMCLRIIVPPGEGVLRKVLKQMGTATPSKEN